MRNFAEDVIHENTISEELVQQLYEQSLPELIQDLTENSETTAATTEGLETNGQVDILCWADSRRARRTPTTFVYSD